MKNVKAKLVLQVGKSLGAEIGWKRSVFDQAEGADQKKAGCYSRQRNRHQFGGGAALVQAAVF